MTTTTNDVVGKLEDEEWNRKRTQLELDVCNSVLRLLDHTGWPASIVVPHQNLEFHFQVKVKGANG